ncbi:hypothetical protein EYF80_035681 [Liparis tanakae]|uniref:Uncharacterized protein n=1 Tax=Liparis tanakae TaxID=230148 RepID=A0A4Z2GN82_9TELE|nr:hypothetical protein EYF80_035681 [Liparis tanakae]
MAGQRSHKEPLGATRSHTEPQGATRSHTEPLGATRSPEHGDSGPSGLEDVSSGETAERKASVRMRSLREDEEGLREDEESP